ncbi:hypothetical protein [Streptomyces sp. NPDC005407]|uniref:hypothetical protein n=1 Tax=Streptomyces sp. NPDC005407 TaxID=3155340 RepID=UPI0033B7815B
MHARHSAAAAVILVAALGCSSLHTPSGTDSPLPPPGPAATEPAQLVLPMDAYTLNERDAALISTAEDRLIQACMARHHQRWPLLDHSAPTPMPNQNRYGLTDATAAEQLGYHPPPDPQADRQEAQHTARDTALTTAQQAAAYGPDGQSGCHAQARRALLRGVPQADWNLLDRLTADSYARSRRTTQVVTAIRAWSACMNRAGHDYADPMDANDDPRWDTPQPSLDEIATARTDVQCTQRTAVVLTWWKAETAIQRKLTAAHREHLHALSQAREGYLANARDLEGQGLE